MIDFIHNSLFTRYGLDVHSVKKVAGGWSASCFVALTNRGKYFVKVYDRRRPSVQPWIERIGLYMPVLLWLSENTSLREQIVAPILTQNADYRVENTCFVLILFPFLEGHTLCETPLTSTQISQIAKILALLHSHGEDIPVPTKQLTETYSLPFLDSLDEVIHDKSVPSALWEIMQMHLETMKRATNTLRLLAEQIRNNPPHYALCHTDVHGWNLMWDKQLILIDWEGLQLAPVESDLFTFSDGFFFDYATDEFFASYMEARPEYIVDKAAMHFYRLRRRMEDISEFSNSIAYDDNLASNDVEESLSHLQKECSALKRL